QRWSAPAAWSTTGEFGVSPDGSVFMIAPGYVLKRLDPATGATLATSTVTVGNYAPRMGVDALGRLFFSNGDFANSRVISFDPGLTRRWAGPVANVNMGARAIGRNGTLVVASTTGVTAYRTAHCYANCDASTTPPVLNVADFSCFLNRFAAGD